MTEKIGLDELVRQLDPDKIQKEVVEPHAKARAEYGSTEIKVESWQEFREAMISYVQHHHKAIYGNEIDEVNAYAKAENMLNALRREEGGIQSAYKDAKGGKLQDILTDLQKGMESEHIENYNIHVLGQIEPDDFEHKKSLMSQYIKAYKKLIPEDVAAELETKDPGALVPGFTELTKSYARTAYAAKNQLKK